MSLTITKAVRLNSGARGRIRIEDATPKPNVPTDRMCRISRLMGLTIETKWFIDGDADRDYAELARLGHASRDRVCQIINLIMLALDLEAEPLFRPRVGVGRQAIQEHAVLRIVAMIESRKQRT